MRELDLNGLAHPLSTQFTESEIARTAILLVQRYGTSALDYARQRCLEAVKVDDARGAEIWQRIIDALQRAEGAFH